MRRIDRLLADYGESHQNPTNKRIYWVCVPVIFTSVMALVSLLPPLFGVNWLWIAAALVLAYYLVLSPRLAAGFVLVFVLAWGVILLVAAVVPLPLWTSAAIAFVLAWVGQFQGHRIEGRRPSFFKDLQFLLIGPAWLLSFVYCRLGLAW